MDYLSYTVKAVFTSIYKSRPLPGQALLLCPAIQRSQMLDLLSASKALLSHAARIILNQKPLQARYQP